MWVVWEAFTLLLFCHQHRVKDWDKASSREVLLDDSMAWLGVIARLLRLKVSLGLVRFWFVLLIRSVVAALRGKTFLPILLSRLSSSVIVEPWIFIIRLALSMISFSCIRDLRRRYIWLLSIGLVHILLPYRRLCTVNHELAVRWYVADALMSGINVCLHVHLHPLLTSHAHVPKLLPGLLKLNLDLPVLSPEVLTFGILIWETSLHVLISTTLVLLDILQTGP